MQRGYLRGDLNAARRLERLARAFDREAEYDRMVESGHAQVRRDLNAPPGAALGWYFRQPEVRAARAALGLRSDYRVARVGGRRQAA